MEYDTLWLFSKLFGVITDWTRLFFNRQWCGEDFWVFYSFVWRILLHMCLEICSCTAFKITTNT